MYNRAQKYLCDIESVLPHILKISRMCNSPSEEQACFQILLGIVSEIFLMEAEERGEDPYFEIEPNY